MGETGQPGQSGGHARPTRQSFRDLIGLARRAARKPVPPRHKSAPAV
jgi:hypothetical protein